MMLQLITPGAEPVTLADAKLHLRVTSSDEDTRITSLIAAARSVIERRIGRALLASTWKQSLDEFPVGAIVLPLPPLISVTSVQYVDTNGDVQTMPSGDYVVEAPSGPTAAMGMIRLSYGKVWPTVRAEINAVRVVFVAGYAAVPQSLVEAILIVLGDLYANREAQIVGTNVAINPAVAALTDDFRVEWV